MSTTHSTIVLALGTGPTDGASVAALRLADAAVQRGHEVTVYAYGEAVRLGADGCPTAEYVDRLLHRDHRDDRPGSATWIVDGQDPRTTTQIAGVIRGDGSDLWRAVRDGDVVLGVTP